MTDLVRKQPERTALDALLAQVEKAEGPDREIEWALAYWQGLGTPKEVAVYEELGGAGFKRGPDGLSALDKRHGSHIRYSRYVGGGRRARISGGGEIMRVVTGPQPLAHCPNYTASIDTALALVEAVMPGAEYEINTLYGACVASLPVNGSDGFETARRDDGNVPLTIIAALLKSAETFPAYVRIGKNTQPRNPIEQQINPPSNGDEQP